MCPRTAFVLPGTHTCCSCTADRQHTPSRTRRNERCPRSGPRRFHRSSRVHRYRHTRYPHTIAHSRRRCRKCRNSWNRSSRPRRSWWPTVRCPQYTRCVAKRTPQHSCRPCRTAPPRRSVRRSRSCSGRSPCLRTSLRIGWCRCRTRRMRPRCTVRPPHTRARTSRSSPNRSPSSHIRRCSVTRPCHTRRLQRLLPLPNSRRRPASVRRPAFVRPRTPSKPWRRLPTSHYVVFSLNPPLLQRCSLAIIVADVPA